MDAFAWIEYLDGSSRGAKVRNVLEAPQNSIITSTVTLAELVSKYARARRDPKVAIAAVESNSTLQSANPELAVLAGEVHAEEKRRKKDFGLADAFVLATARTRSSRVLTGDPHFKDIPEAIMV
ncbi:MAG TPA: PIN domain-containing protein [Candidatus Bathyarchaeia archaeon]|nr:PIN domain-containing protein [Candidatus Bathyarchaeia archaeon]